MIRWISICFTLATAWPSAVVVFGEKVTDSQKLQMVTGVIALDRKDCPKGKAILKVCGATRIGQQLVATAGHCVTRPQVQGQKLVAHPLQEIYVAKSIIDIPQTVATRDIEDCRKIPSFDSDKWHSVSVENSEILFEADFQTQKMDDVAILHTPSIENSNLKIMNVASINGVKTSSFQMIGPGTTDCQMIDKDQQMTVRTEPKNYGIRSMQMTLADSDWRRGLEQFFQESNSQVIWNTLKDSAILVISTGPARTCNGDSGSGLLSLNDRSIFGVASSSSYSANGIAPDVLEGQIQHPKEASAFFPLLTPGNCPLWSRLQEKSIPIPKSAISLCSQ